MENKNDVQLLDEFVVRYSELSNEISKVIIGQKCGKRSFNFYFLWWTLFVGRSSWSCKKHY